MEPEGMVKACTTKARMTRARRTATTMASPYSRTMDFRRGLVAASTGVGVASGRVSISLTSSAVEHRQERLLRQLDLPDLLHALLALFLLLEELPLPGDVPAVALGGDVLAHGLDGLPGDDATADGGLDGHLVELPRDDRPELLGERLPLLVCLVPVGDGGQRVDGVAVEEDVQLHQLRRAEVEELVVEGGVALGDGLELVVEVHHDLGEREVEQDVHALAQVLQ